MTLLTMLLLQWPGYDSSLVPCQYTRLLAIDGRFTGAMVVSAGRKLVEQVIELVLVNTCAIFFAEISVDQMLHFVANTVSGHAQRPSSMGHSVQKYRSGHHSNNWDELRGEGDLSSRAWCHETLGSLYLHFLCQ